MKTSQIIAICFTVIAVVAIIIGGMTYSAKQGTERREMCVTNGGTWVANYCINPDGSVTEN